MRKIKNTCTLWLEGNWSDCCYDHDIGCLLAEEYNNPALRKAVDQKLKRCVEEKGHPVVAMIMYMAVRAYAVLKGGF